VKNTKNSDRPDREGKRLLAIHASEPVHRTLKILAAEQGTTIGALLYEAVGLLLVAYGKPLPLEIDIELAAKRRDKISTAVDRLMTEAA
jgi:transcriptional regulator of met regulon